MAPMAAKVSLWWLSLIAATFLAIINLVSAYVF
jgi:hypothetical protein